MQFHFDKKKKKNTHPRLSLSASQNDISQNVISAVLRMLLHSRARDEAQFGAPGGGVWRWRFSLPGCGANKVGKREVAFKIHIRRGWSSKMRINLTYFTMSAPVSGWITCLDASAPNWAAFAERIGDHDVGFLALLMRFIYELLVWNSPSWAERIFPSYSLWSHVAQWLLMQLFVIQSLPSPPVSLQGGLYLSWHIPGCVGGGSDSLSRCEHPLLYCCTPNKHAGKSHDGNITNASQ